LRASCTFGERDVPASKAALSPGILDEGCRRRTPISFAARFVTTTLITGANGADEVGVADQLHQLRGGTTGLSFGLVRAASGRETSPTPNWELTATGR
jgi:hypothetical protein